VNGADITNLFKLCCRKGKIEITDHAQDKRDFLMCINAKLAKLNLKLKNISDEEDRDKKSFLALVNLTDRSREENALTIKAMHYFTPHEIDYLKYLIEGIMNHPAKQLGQTSALNAISQVKSKKLGVLDAEQILEKLVEHKWLIVSMDRVRFHPRFIAEMESWLKDVYPELVNTCSACQKMVIKYLQCPNEGKCEAVYHLHCIYDRKVRQRGVCIRCKTDMDEKIFGGVRVQVNKKVYVSKKSDETMPSQSSGTKTGAKRKRSRIVANDSSDSDN